jgi:hypothetical protein
MAGNYTRGSDVGSYSHPYFTGQHQHCWTGAAGQASGTLWAHFASRNKVLVSRVSVLAISAPSATAGSLQVIHYDTAGTATTLKGLTLSGCSLGFATTLTLTEKTLETISQYIALKLTANEKGDWIVTYDYQVLFPDTYA